MPENPLLPNKTLQQLYAIMLRARRAALRGNGGLEAIQGAVALLLEPGDAVISARHGNLFAALLGPAKRTQSAAKSLNAPSHPFSFANGVAAGAQVAGNARLAVNFIDGTAGAAAEPDWPVRLGWAQRERLPLITICLDNPLPKATPTPAREALTWNTLGQVAKKLRFPVLTVDGADAVAMVRALQESVLRARHGDGPALLWCLMPSGDRPSAEAAPVERLEHYLAARRIALPRMTDPPERRHTAGSSGKGQSRAQSPVRL